MNAGGATAVVPVLALLRRLAVFDSGVANQKSLINSRIRAVFVFKRQDVEVTSAVLVECAVLLTGSESTPTFSNYHPAMANVVENDVHIVYSHFMFVIF